MRNGYIAVIEGIDFNLNSEVHTVAYVERARTVAASIDPQKWLKRIMAVASEDYDHCIEMLKKNACEYLTDYKLNPKDFSIQVKFSEVKDGNFWLQPSMHGHTVDL